MLLPLSAFPANSAALSYGMSKLFQILVPLSAYMFFKEVPVVKQTLWRLLSPFTSDESRWRFEYYFDLAIGFMTWKIGCDLGFLLVATGVAEWQRSFTLIGLIPYTIAQYLVYYLVGQKMIIQGQLNPFKEEFIPPQVIGRPPLWKHIASRWLHETGNATSPNVPLRQVFLKPAIDYGGIVVSWSIYTSGLLFLQSGEVSFAPLFHFTFLEIFTFYLINVFGFIIGFNVGEWLYMGTIALEERLECWLHGQTLAPANEVNPLSQPLQTIRAAWVRFKTTQTWRIEPFVQRYGINLRWFMCAGLGVMAVIFFEPYMADPILNTSHNLHDAWYREFGDMASLHVEQVAQPTQPQAMPPSERLFEEFPKKWGFLYFLD